MMNTVTNKAQVSREKTALMTLTMRSAVVKIILQVRLMLLKKIKRKASKTRMEIRRSLKLILVHFTIRRWP